MTRPIDVSKPISQEDYDYLVARGDARVGVAEVAEEKSKAPAKGKADESKSDENDKG